MTGCVASSPPARRGGFRIFFRVSARGGGVLAGTPETGEPGLGKRGGRGGGLEASEGLTGPPGGLKYDLEEKGSSKYLRGYRVQVTLP
jgi:hypothetical protein